MKSKLFIFTLLASGVAFLSANTHGADVKELWEKNCASCHGKDGKGNTTMGRKVGAKDYTDPKVQDAMQDEKAFKAIKEGIKDNGKVVMKSYSPPLTDEEIKALVAHVRQFKRP